MKTKTYIAFAVALIASLCSATAATFSLNDGTTIVGELSELKGRTVVIKTDDGSATTQTFSRFDAASKKAIKAWKQDKAAQKSKSVTPVITAGLLPQLPEQFKNPAFKGYAQVEVTIDTSGNVVHASIRDSSHAELNAAVLEAAKTWSFRPAKKDGQVVQSKVRIPFNFSYTEKSASDIMRDTYLGKPYSVL